MPHKSANETTGQTQVSGSHLRPMSQTLPGKQIHGNLHNGVDTSGDGQIRNGRPRVDGRGKSQLLSRYWPRFTDQDLQKLSLGYPLLL